MDVFGVVDWCWSSVLATEASKLDDEMTDWSQRRKGVGALIRQVETDPNNEYAERKKERKEKKGREVQ